MLPKAPTASNKFKLALKKNIKILKQLSNSIWGDKCLWDVPAWSPVYLTFPTAQRKHQPMKNLAGPLHRRWKNIKSSV